MVGQSLTAAAASCFRSQGVGQSGDAGDPDFGYVSERGA